MQEKFCFRKAIALVLSVAVIIQLSACGMKETAQNAKEATVNAVNNTKDTVADAVGNASSAVANAADVAKDSVVNAVGSATDAVADAAIDAKDAVVGAAESAKDAIVNTTENAINSVVSWYESIDLSAFEDGWNTAVGYVGSAYATTLSSTYVANVEQAISALKMDINASSGTARGVAQEAGFVAEKWTAGTFNIDAAAKESSYHATVEGSNKLGSVDVSTNYGENASLKYYSDAKGSANAQAEVTNQAFEMIQGYHEYASAASDSGTTPMSFKEYLDFVDYQATSSDALDALIESMYSEQSRIIPTDQLEEAKLYLEGKIARLNAMGDEISLDSAKRYQETLDQLNDRLSAPDGTESEPLSRNESLKMTEQAQKGEFDPEDFGIKLSQEIDPKYVLKQAVGTGIESGLLKAAFVAGPDLVSIIAEGVRTGVIDENALEQSGIEGAIAMGEGFVEGAVSRIVVTMCQSGAFGDALKGASPSVVGAFVFLTIEAMISGYALAKGEITTEEYGYLIADRTLTTVLAIPTTALLISVLPGTKLCVLIGCLGGGILASSGYTLTKELVLELADGGGFEAIIPQGAANSLEMLKENVASLDLSGELPNLHEFAVTTVSTGLIKIKQMVP